MRHQIKPLGAVAHRKASVVLFLGIVLGIVPGASRVYGQQSISLQRRGTVSVASGLVPYSRLTNIRLDGRIHGWQPDPQLRTVVDFSAANNFRMAILNSFLFFTDGYDNQSLQIPLTGYGPDVLWRFNRNTFSQTLTLEAWNVDGSNYNVASFNIAATAGTAINLSPATWGLGDTNLPATTYLSYLRMYSTISGPSNVPDAPLIAGGDLLDYEFEGNGSDASGHGLNWSLSAPNFVRTPTYGPAVIVKSPPTTVRAGGDPVTLDASQSYSLGPSSGLTFVWNQLGGPPLGVASWSAQNTGVVTFTAPVFGQYDLIVQATDSAGLSTSRTFSIGAVATDDNGVVITGSAAVDAILGPMIRFGANPWPWADDRHKYLADAVGNALDVYWPAFWDAPSAGTVDATNQSQVLVGHGTHFTTDLCQGPANPATPQNGAYIFVWYSSVDYPGTTGRVAYSVGSCTSDTQLTVTGGAWQYAAELGMQYTALVDPGTGPFTNWNFSNISANYYDNVMALYAMYYRSGLTQYQTWAHTLVDRWWRMPKIDRGQPYNIAQQNVGSAFFENRNWSLAGIMLRSLELGDPTYWTGLSHFLDFYAGHLASPLPHNDMRVQGYATRDFALCAQFAQGNPSQPSYYTSGDLRSNCQASLVQQATGTGGLVSWQDPVNRNWTWTYAPYGTFSGGTTGVGANSTVNVTNGSTIVTAASGSTRFGSVGTTDPSNGSLVNFLFCDNSSPASNMDCDPSGYGKASTIDDNTMVLSTPYEGTSGVKTWVAGSFSYYGTIPYMQGLAGYGFSQAATSLLAAGDTVNSGIYKQFNLDVANWLWNARRVATTGVYFARYFVNCEPPGNNIPAGSQDACSAGAQTTNSRIDVGQVIRGLSQAYLNSGLNPAIKAQNDAFYNALFAKPGFAVPAGFVTDPDYIRPLDSAPDCDRTQGDCGYMVSLAPGTNYLNSPFLNKWLGFFFGTGGAYSWPAARAVGRLTPPTSPTRQVPIDLAATGAAQARITVLQPTGRTIQTTCAASPCAVQVDVRQGNHRIKIDYLSAAGDVIAPASSFSRLPAQ